MLQLHVEESELRLFNINIVVSITGSRVGEPFRSDKEVVEVGHYSRPRITTFSCPRSHAKPTDIARENHDGNRK